MSGQGVYLLPQVSFKGRLVLHVLRRELGGLRSLRLFRDPLDLPAYYWLIVVNSFYVLDRG